MALGSNEELMLVTIFCAVQSHHVPGILGAVFHALTALCCIVIVVRYFGLTKKETP